MGSSAIWDYGMIRCVRENPPVSRWQLQYKKVTQELSTSPTYTRRWKLDEAKILSVADRIDILV